MFRKLFLIVGLMLATTMLSGCVVETPAPWGWHHHDWR
jgi:hypothetical protein